MASKSIILAMMLVVATIPAPAAAASDDLVSVDIQKQTPDTLGGKASAALDMVSGILSGVSVTNGIKDLTGDEPDPQAQADDLRTYLNSHESEFVSHTNKVADEYNATVGNGTYVLELTIADEPDDPDKETTIYFVGNGNGTHVTSYDVVNNTSKTADRSRTLSSFEAEDLNDDIREYHDEFVSTGEVPEKGYYIQLVSKYGNVSEITVGGE